MPRLIGMGPKSVPTLSGLELAGGSSDSSLPNFRMSRLKLPIRIFRCGGPLVFPAGNFDQVVAELSLDWSLNRIEFGAEYDVVEFFDHHSRSKRPEVAALFSRRASRELSGYVGEVFAASDRLLKVVTDFFGFDKYVSGCGFGHLIFLFIFKIVVLVDSIAPVCQRMCPGDN